jgi:extracellular factor (EF) 3-hydroxypalmitic acid methyl ester biosynthesis protein
MLAIEEFLGVCLREIEHGDIHLGVATLSEGLTEYRLKLTDSDWSTQVLAACKNHPLATLLQEDPYTRRAIEKPRGYSGDAVMMDYVYFQKPPIDCSEQGKRIFLAVTASPNGASVRWRREHIASLIDAEALRRSNFSVLSVACGHCREYLLLKSETRNKLKRFLALDQDAESINVISDNLNITPLRMSAKNLANDQSLQGFDLVYSAGLFDYLSDKSAIALSNILLDRAASGGTVLIANFTPDNWGRGYMDAFMNWQLILRTKNDMRRLIPNARVASSYLYYDPYRNVIYLKMTKA